MSTLESRIDELYRGPLSGFITGRDALAGTLSGADRRRVKGLAKPTALAWAVNQTYWHTRPLYERVLRSGEQLRAAQIGSLQGLSMDVPGTTARHCEAVSRAVTAASRITTAAGLHPPAESLRRMFEAISMSEALPERHGRFAKPLQPAGFEALAGIAIPSGARVQATGPKKDVESTAPRGAHTEIRLVENAKQTEQARRNRERVQAERRRQAALRKAEAAVARAAAAEARARETWERSRQQLEEAGRRLGHRRDR